MDIVTFKNYNRSTDFDQVGRMLIASFEPENQDGNWLQPTWEYMHSHTMLDTDSLSRIGIWESKGVIVGVVHYESSLGEIFFQTRSDYAHLKREMLDYAERHLLGTTKTGSPFARVFVNDFDLELENLVQARGYQLEEHFNRPISEFRIPHPFPAIPVPDGFHLQSLADDNDLEKIHRCLWRGFNHPGEPPPEGIQERAFMQDTPNFRKDLTIVATAPNGDFAAFCGMWWEPTNRIAYVEPVATDPDYRRLGLGRAVVMEGIRRCGTLGATSAFVGSDLPFYLSVGFIKRFDSRCWVRHWNEPI